MAKWIKCSDRLPSEDGSYFVIGKMGRGSILYIDGEWSKKNPHMQVFEEVIEWLDESEPSFTIEDMSKCWDKCNLEHSDRSGCGLPKSIFKDFMETKYNIKLPD